MARIGTAWISVDADLDPFKRAVESLRTRQFTATVDVKADIDQASFANAKRKGGTLGGSEEVKLKADVDTSSFARARTATALLTKESSKLSDVFSRSNLSIGQWTGILASAAPVILDTAGALGALTASLGAATAGLGALAVGGAGAAATGFGGIAAIAVPAIKSLKDLMTAQTAANKAQVTGAAGAGRAQAAAAQQIKSAQDQVKTATEGVATAENQLADAQRSEKIAQDALTLARKDAVRQLQDMKLAADEAGTSEKRARLSLQEAEANLRQLQASGTASALDIKDAELSIVEARQNVRDVTIQGNRAQQDYNKAQRQGINGMPGVVSAQRSLADASRSVQSAQQGVTQAHDAVAKALQNLAFQQKQANAATGAGGISMAALALAQKKAGPAAVAFAHQLKDMTKSWHGLTAAGRDDFFGILSDGLRVATSRLQELAKSANTSMAALRGGFGLFLKQATGSEFDKFIQAMTRTFANAIPPLADAFGNIAKILERIAVAVGPDVVRVIKQLDQVTKGWVASTANASKLRDTIHGLVNQTETWAKLIGAAGRLIVAVLVPGAGQGQKAVKGITDQLNEWTRFVNAHPREIRDFFKEALKTTSAFAQVLLGFIPQLFQISVAMRPIARAFLSITKALNTIKIGNVSALTALLGAFIAGRIIKSVAGLVTSLNLVRDAYIGIRAAALGAAAAETTANVAAAPSGATIAQGVNEARATQAIGGGTNAAAALPFAGMGKAFQGTEGAAAGIGATSSKLAVFAKTAGGATIAITALVGAVEVLRTNFLGIRGVIVSVYNRGIRPLGQAFKDLVDALTAGHANEIFRAMGRALQAIKGPLLFAVKNFTKLLGVLAVGAFAAILAPVVALTVALRVQLKVLTFLVKAFTHLPDVAKAAFGAIKSAAASAAGFIKNRWGDIGHVLSAPFKALKGVFAPIINFIISKIRAAIETAKKLADALPKPGVSLHHIGPVPVPIPHFAHGGFVQGFAAGGRVGGDTVPAMLSPGEFVLSKDMLKRLKQGDNLALDKKIVTDTRKRAKDTAEGLTDELSKGHKKAKDDTKKFTGDHDNLMNVMRQASNNDIDNLAQHTIQGFQRTHQESIQQSGSMKKGVVTDFQNMASGAIAGIKKLADATNKALKALGVDPVKFGVSDTGGNSNHPHGHQTGGMVVPGSGPGDKVHLQAMVEPGERVFVLNRNASEHLSQLQSLNSNVPRFQQGGIIDRTGIPHFAKGGGMSAMIAEVDKFEAQHFPYVAGGGHSSFGVQPVDCSGFVSDILHVAGLLNAPMTTLGLANWGKKGKGPLTVWNRATGGPGNGHVVIELNGRVAGTSGSNRGGGAGWIAGATGPELVYSAVPRTMDVKGGALTGSIKNVILQGAKGPLLDMAQAAVSKVHDAANKYLQKKAPSGAFGGPGEPLKDLPPSLEKYNRSYAGSGATMPLNKIAELAEWAGHGRIPGKTMAQVTIGEASQKPGNVSGDGGYGLWQITTPFGNSAIQQAGFSGYNDMLNPVSNAKVMAIMYPSGWSGGSPWYGTGSVTSYNAHYTGPMKQKGGLLPYAGKFHQGGVVPFDGMGLLKGGEIVLPKLKDSSRVTTGSGLGGGGGLTPAEIFDALGLGQKSFKARLRILKQTLKTKGLDKGIKPQIERLIEETNELKQEEKALRLELKEHHRLRAATRANEAAALRAVTNLVGSQIGFQTAQKRRLAAGSTRSY